jgi:hypothetical protein
MVGSISFTLWYSQPNCLSEYICCWWKFPILCHQFAMNEFHSSTKIFSNWQNVL